MSRDASITLPFADGEYTFKLGMKVAEELQTKTDAGPQWICNRLESETWHVPDIVETIRLGLIGGGLSPEKARNLVKSYVQERPLLENIDVAKQILLAWLRGTPDEPPKKELGQAMNGESQTSQTESSVSPPSMEPVP